MKELRELLEKATPGKWSVIGKQGTAIWAGNSIIASSTLARSAPTVAHANSVLMASVPSLLDKVERYEKALKQFASCNLNEGNCASLEVASRRIRNIATKALEGAGHAD